jgi:hypothetical protein
VPQARHETPLADLDLADGINAHATASLDHQHTQEMTNDEFRHSNFHQV